MIDPFAGCAVRLKLYCIAQGYDNPDMTKGYQYVTWLNEHLRQWQAETGHKGPYTKADHAAFDAWLSETVEGESDGR